MASECQDFDTRFFGVNFSLFAESPAELHEWDGGRQDSKQKMFEKIENEDV